MNKITKISLIALVYTVIFGLPVTYVKTGIDFSLITTFIIDGIVVLPMTIILFFLLSIIPYIGTLIIALFFVVGFISNSFVYNFRKNFDEGVVNDLLSIEADLVNEYFDISTAIITILGFILIYYVLHKLLHNSKYKNNSRITLIVMNVCFISLFVSSIMMYFFGRDSRFTILNYLPYSIVHNVVAHAINHQKYIKISRNKVDLSKNYVFEFKDQGDEPLTVVMIIGESMRSSTVSPRNMPLLHERNNVVLFKNAISSSTSTRESIPYMLTSAIPPNIDQSLQEKSFVTIFKNLGFETSWIGNQGLFSVYEVDFATIALEADYVVTKLELRKMARQSKNYDEQVLPFVEERLKDYSDNNLNSLTVVHLQGSHWRFDQRLPPSFNAPFKPECDKKLPSACSYEQVRNSYENSFYYTDIVIDQLLKKLEHKNAIVFYSSDHGVSLGEDGFFGNVSKELLAQKDQRDVAMFVWFSDKFLQNNPSIIKTVEQKRDQGQVISHDYIFHSILDCAGVKSDYIDPSLSLCVNIQSGQEATP